MSSPDLRLCLELDPVDEDDVLAALDGEGLDEPCPTFKCRVCEILHVPANTYSTQHYNNTLFSGPFLCLA
jgi:hypothetical protein